MTHVINPLINDRQRNFIKGTILGGSSIIKPAKGKNCYLSMRGKDLEWLRYKAGELSQFASQDPITVETTNRWHSVCYPLFTEFRDVFYTNDDRSLKIDIMSGLTDFALAIWFGDCGEIKNNKVILNTHIWGEKGSEVICEYFGYLDYNSKIFTERKNFRVKLNEESSKDFLKIICPVLPHFYLTRMSIPNHTSKKDQ